MNVKIDPTGLKNLQETYSNSKGIFEALELLIQKINNVGQGVGLAIAVIAVHLAIALTLMASTTILKVIKDTGVNLVASIAGLLLAAIAIQMIADAIKAFTAA
jgi:multiple antibiotic resistance protein